MPKASFTFVKNDYDVSFSNTSTNSGSYFWYFGDSWTSSLENPNHTYESPDIYTATIIASNQTCGESTFSTEIWIMTGIETMFLDDLELNIYPNPSKGYFTVDLGDVSSMPMRIDIMNTTGSLVYSDRIQIGKRDHMLDLSDKVDGLYILRVSSETSMKSILVNISR